MADSRRYALLGILFPRRLTHWLGPLIAAGAFAGLVGILLITSGILNLGASTPHPEGWAKLLHYVFQRSVAHHASGIAVPADLDSPARVQKGAVYFSRVCAGCHGAPGLGQNPIALAMRPRPQYLKLVVGQFEPAELFYILQHGVKYSAMPAWPARDREDEVWSIVAFLRQLPKLQRAGYDELAQGPAGQAAGPMGFSPPFDGAQPRRYRLANDTEFPFESSYTRPATAFGRGIVGPDIAQACVQCHGVDGAGRPGGSFPNLTVLNSATLKKALHAYADGTRQSAYMQPVAVQLSDAQIDALGEYFRSQPRRLKSPQFNVAPATLALGRQIAEIGLPAKNVGACQSCHDINRANRRYYPAIAGQNLLYLRDQLRLYRAGVRNPVTTNPMIKVAKRMTDLEIDAATAWYAALPPLAPEAVPEAPTKGQVSPPTR